uniref:OTU domain-containing protein n=1 Tax=viral metagenome TaxID=1070528 RepID=A0A6C0JUV8_9ZZZZ
MSDNVNYIHLVKNLYLIETVGDGNCMYHSILNAIDKTYRESGDDAYKSAESEVFRKMIKDKLFSTDWNHPPYTVWETSGRGSLLTNFVETMGAGFDPEETLKFMEKGFCDQPYYIFYIIANVIERNIVVLMKNKGAKWTTDKYLSTKPVSRCIIVYMDEYASSKKGDEVRRYYHYSTVAIEHEGKLSLDIGLSDEDIIHEPYDPDHTKLILTTADFEWLFFLREYSTSVPEINELLYKYR